MASEVNASPTPPRDLSQFARHWGWLFGAASGLWLALGDFGATWLWLPLWRDRAGLLLRLVAALTPAGGIVGTLLVLLLTSSYRWLGTRHRFAAGWALLAAPALHLLAVKLCSGGTMSRLRFHGPLVWSLSIALPLGTYGVLRAGLWLASRAEESPRFARRCAIALLALSFVLSKVNQTVLPNLYDYLHATLVVACWLLGGLGLLLLAHDLPRLSNLRLHRPNVRHHLLAMAGLFGLQVANTLTLDWNLNVRVALFDPRSPASRALLSAANPLLRRLQQNAHKPASHAQTGQRHADLAGLPVQQGAHVLLVTIDALRADHLGAYGHARPVSPGLDALAKQGLMFRRAYAQAPHSSYSLSSLHASEYLHELVELGRPLPAATLASTLRDAGYHTAAFFTDGIFHTEGHKLAQYRDNAFGFALFDHTNRESEQQTDRVLAEVDRIREQGEPPSLLWVHYFDVHEPYQETTFGTSDVDRYDSEILHVDRELKRLLDELEKRFEREVVVAISADHGEEFREHGGVYHGSTLFEEQTRVPLLFRAKGIAPALVEAPVEVIDIAPTLLGMVGVTPPASMRGRDLRARALGRQREVSPVFSAVLTKRMAVRYPLKLIADLRFGLFELYDLEQDPHERRNLAQERPAELAMLRSDIYGWLDSLEQQRDAPAEPEDPRARALRWGRLGDRRAVQPMSALLLDQAAPEEQRIEAGQILAKLADESSAEGLLKGLDTRPPSVAAEAAIALGRMYDERARTALSRLVHVEDPYLRARAAVSLGRLRDVQAVPALIDALWVAPSLYEREEAVRWLGRLGDARAVEPLIALIPEFGMRYLVAVALGQLGDARAFDALADMLRWEERTNIRDEVVRGLGLLGDARAIPLLLTVLAEEPGLKQTSESLVRLGAVGTHMGGTDVGPGLRGATGMTNCQAGPLKHDWDYAQRTFCLVRSGSQLRLLSAGPSTTLIVRMRREDAPDAVEVTVRVDGHAVPPLRIDGTWSEQRIKLPLSNPTGLRIEAAAGVTLALDHALLLGGRSEPKASGDAQRVD